MRLLQVSVQIGCGFCVGMATNSIFYAFGAFLALEYIGIATHLANKP